MATTYLEKLTDFMISLKLSDIPTDVRENTGFFLLDAIGVALANRNKPFVRLQANVIERTSKDGACTVIGQSRRYVAEGAAQLNSTAIHGSDFDATHLPSIMHTSSVIFPTAIAVAEETHASGAELIRAAVGGSEVLIRMGLATQGAMHRLGFQSTALCAPIALGLLAGSMYRMSREQIVSAAGLAASICAGLRAFSDDGTWGKRLITGWACRAGLTSAALAREGYPGTADALEKEPFGFYKAFVQGGGYELTELTRGLGDTWTSRDIDLKRYPCSHGHHAFLDTARRAKRELGLVGEDIESVVLHVSNEARKWWFEPREKKYELANVYGARFSMPYTMALALQYGDLRDEQLDDRSVLESPAIQRLVMCVTAKIDETLSDTNPNRLPGTVEIHTKDGRVATFSGAGHAASGRAFRTSVLEKYWLNVAGIKSDVAERIAELACNIEREPRIDALMRLLRLERSA